LQLGLSRFRLASVARARAPQRSRTSGTCFTGSWLPLDPRPSAIALPWDRAARSPVVGREDEPPECDERNVGAMYFAIQLQYSCEG
jgi:hypothetical protein